MWNKFIAILENDTGEQQALLGNQDLQLEKQRHMCFMRDSQGLDHVTMYIIMLQVPFDYFLCLSLQLEKR